MIEIKEIGPELAAQILAGQNGHNRRVRPERVHAIADDITNGRWKVNGETIKFAVDGTLLDGQHRLAAIIEAGIPATTAVVSDLPIASQETMDTGATRTFADVLHLRGEHNSTVLASGCRILWEWQRLGGTLAPGHINAQPTHAQLSQMLADNPGLREASAIGGRISRSAQPIPASVGTLLAYLLYRIDEEDAAWFVECLCTGAGLAPGSPILALRTLLRNYSGRANIRPERRMILGATIKAWNAYRAGELVQVLSFRPGGAHPERFPEPK